MRTACCFRATEEGTASHRGRRAELDLLPDSPPGERSPGGLCWLQGPGPRACPLWNPKPGPPGPPPAVQTYQKLIHRSLSRARSKAFFRRQEWMKGKGGFPGPVSKSLWGTWRKLGPTAQTTAPFPSCALMRGLIFFLKDFYLFI